jgi:SAM-dependent methyltransferase
MAARYVHGYSRDEQRRLLDQAQALHDLLHGDTFYPPGSRVLEAGCGVGAQTVILASRSPGAFFTSLDISAASLALARERVAAAELKNVEFLQEDMFRLPFPDGHFDHIFVCFVLEHLADPAGALESLRRVVRRGGTITVIEGDHGSTCLHPDSPHARRVIQCLIDLQATMGGNSLIGRSLYPLLVKIGFTAVSASPRLVYVDGSRPALAEGFIRQTFIAMVEGVRDQALERRLIEPREWERGIADLYRTAEPDGVFCYTFFKAVGIRTEE